MQSLPGPTFLLQLTMSVIILHVLPGSVCVFLFNQVEDKTYSSLHPPPDVPGMDYSISKIITRGARYL